MARRACVVLLASVLVMAASLGAGTTVAARTNFNGSACPYFSAYLNQFRGTANEPALQALSQDCASTSAGFVHSSGTACTVPSTTYPTIASAFTDTNCSEIDLVSRVYSAANIDVTHDVTLFGNGATIGRDIAGSVFFVEPNVTFNVQGVLFITAWYGSYAITNYGDLNIASSWFVGSNLRNAAAPAPDGGAISDFGTSATISSSVFISNLGSLGGAIAHESPGSMTILNSIFAANGRGIGIAGAVYSTGGTLDVEQSLFAFNDSIFGDGAVVVNNPFTYTHSGNLFLFNK